MSVRELTGTDLITCDEGTADSLANGAYTMLGLIKPLTTSGDDSYIDVGNHQALMYHSGTALFLGGDLGDVQESLGSLTASEWQVLAIGKASGTVTPRMHRKVLGSGSWKHSDMSGTYPNDATVATSIRFGDVAALGTNMRIAVAALFSSQLSDGTIESIESNASTAFLNSLTPVALWDFNQANVADDVLDLTGNGANETAISGTTVIGGDDPAWAFGLTSASIGHDLSYVNHPRKKIAMIEARGRR